MEAAAFLRGVEGLRQSARAMMLSLPLLAGGRSGVLASYLALEPKELQRQRLRWACSGSEAKRARSHGPA